MNVVPTCPRVQHFGRLRVHAYRTPIVYFVQCSELYSLMKPHDMKWKNCPFSSCEWTIMIFTAAITFKQRYNAQVKGRKPITETVDAAHLLLAENPVWSDTFSAGSMGKPQRFTLLIWKPRSEISKSCKQSKGMVQKEFSLVFRTVINMVGSHFV